MVQTYYLVIFGYGLDTQQRNLVKGVTSCIGGKLGREVWQGKVRNNNRLGCYVLFGFKCMLLQNDSMHCLDHR